MHRFDSILSCLARRTHAAAFGISVSPPRIQPWAARIQLWSPQIWRWDSAMGGTAAATGSQAESPQGE
ncbi:MAG: hypothetical protein ACUVQK_09880 [Thermogutta sp.]